jgi:hypothetical protein
VKVKKIISLLLVVAVTISVFAFPALADTTGKNSDFTIYYGVLTAYKGSGGAITIPNTVTSISDGVFSSCTSLTSVTIPNSVTSIGDGAFSGCTSLTSVTIPNSVTNIGAYAFGVTGLTSVTIPNSVTSIGDDSFCDCTSLTSVTIPSTVTSIGDDAFGDCTSLASVTIPCSVKSIGYEAFEECDHLTIYGEKGSYAQTYAKVNNITFSTSIAIGVSYAVQVQTYGWQSAVINGTLAGTFSESERLEAIKINLTGADLPNGAKITYKAQVQTYGWQDAVSNGAIAGTVGKAKRLEAIKITLSGMPGFEVQYTTQVQDYGWQDWVTSTNDTSIDDAALSGTVGKAKRLEAIEIRIVKTAS